MSGPAYELLSGWGGTPASGAWVHRPAAPEDVERVLELADGRGLIPRGLGRSYGDAAQNAGGTVVDITGLARVHDLDLAANTITVDAGISLDRLMRLLLPFGRFLPVSPGTRHVTIGGAIAADIHGKNHHRDGSFTRFVEELELATPGGLVKAERGSEVFEATAGGMGLTGIILSARIRLLPVETSLVRVDTERAHDLEDLMDRMERRDADYRYSVAWLDCLARGRSLGRGVLTRGDHATLDDLPPERREEPLAFSPKPLGRVPWAPPGLLNRASVRAFNELWFRKAPQRERGRLQKIASFFHPLDALASWNRLYGPRGFLQYQLVLPFGEEAALQRIVERLAKAQVPSFLAVLKRFGAGGGMLSFPRPGWTLALDVPVGTSGLAELLDGLDEMVAKGGGRVYLAKDSRLRPELLFDMYPDLDRFRALRGRVDPDGRMISDLARRLRIP